MRLEPENNHHLPRILCLHGGGTSSEIFRRQCRTLIRLIAPHFRLVFANGPYPCEVAGPDVSAVYASYGPFRRWLRWLPEHPWVDNADGANAIEASMQSAMAQDDAQGGRGDWVGLIGFSQGGKVAASVLLETQVRAETATRRPSWATDSSPVWFAGVQWRFGILLASRAPIVALSDLTMALDGVGFPSDLFSQPPVVGDHVENDHRLRIPTVHVHGTRDAGIKYHRALLQDFTATTSAELVKWEGNHRVPIKTAEAMRIVEATLRAAKVRETVLSSSRGGDDFRSRDQV